MRTSATAGLAMTSAVYTFAQEAAARDMSVTVPVPPSTSKLDVAVTLRADRLRVSVVGHPRQPHVLDGELCYDVDPDCLSWALERAGGATELVIALEKAEPVDWGEGLFRVQLAAPRPEPELKRGDVPASASAAARSVADGVALQPATPAAPAPAPAASVTPSCRDCAKAPAPAPAPAASGTPSRLDYAKWDAIGVSDDDDDSSDGKRPPLPLDSAASEIWADLMAGKKSLLTRDGVVNVGEDAPRA